MIPLMVAEINLNRLDGFLPWSGYKYHKDGIAIDKQSICELSAVVRALSPDGIVAESISGKSFGFVASKKEVKHESSTIKTKPLNLQVKKPIDTAKPDPLGTTLLQMHENGWVAAAFCLIDRDSIGYGPKDKRIDLEAWQVKHGKKGDHKIFVIPEGTVKVF